MFSSGYSRNDTLVSVFCQNETKMAFFFLQVSKHPVYGCLLAFPNANLQSGAQLAIRITWKFANEISGAHLET